MSAAEGTTTALESATPPVAAGQRQPARRRVKVVHYVSIEQEKFAKPLGIPIVYLCGWSKPRAKAGNGMRPIKVVGGLMAVTESRDCKHCIRAYERILAEVASADTTGANA